MSDKLPEGEDLNRAMRWISSQLQEEPDHPVAPLLQEAVFKFDLSPRDAEHLIEFFAQRKQRLSE